MKKLAYKTHGVCSSEIDIEVDDDNRIHDVYFVGGCDGNLKGLCSLVRGMKVEDVKQRLDGIRCGAKRTSCPDQLCRAIDEVLKSGK